MAALKEHTRLKIESGKIYVPIYVGNDILSEINSIVPLADYSKVGVLMDKNVAYHWGEEIRKILGKNVAYIVIPAGEEYKEMATLEKVLTSMLEHGFDRKSLLINLGGGM